MRYLEPTEVSEDGQYFDYELDNNGKSIKDIFRPEQCPFAFCPHTFYYCADSLYNCPSIENNSKIE